MISIASNLNIMIKAVEKASKSIIRDFGEIEFIELNFFYILKGSSI